ncbi:MAG: DMT family transporter [Bacillota bacterium]
MEKPSWTTYFFLFVVAALWGASWVAAKIMVAEIHPFVAGSIRFILVFLLMFPVLLWKEGRQGLPRKRDLPLLFFQGLTGVFLYNVFFLKGMQTTTAINGSLIVMGCPVLTVLFSTLYLKENLRKLQLAGFSIAMLGVMVVIGQGSWEALTHIKFYPGDLLIALCTVVFAAYNVSGKVAAGRVSPLGITTFSAGFGAVMLTVLAYPYFDLVELSQASWSAWGGLLFLVVFATALAFALWFESIKRIGASRAAVFLYLVPVAAALTAILVLHERIYAYHIIGGLLVFCGVYIANHISLGDNKTKGLGEMPSPAR